MQLAAKSCFLCQSGMHTCLLHERSPGGLQVVMAVADAQTSATQAIEARGQPLAVKDALTPAACQLSPARLQVVTAVTDALTSAAQAIEAQGQPLAQQLVSQLAARCCEALQQLRGISMTYRMTAKAMPTRCAAKVRMSGSQELPSSSRYLHDLLHDCQGHDHQVCVSCQAHPDDTVVEAGVCMLQQLLNQTDLNLKNMQAIPLCWSSAWASSSCLNQTDLNLKHAGHPPMLELCLGLQQLFEPD